MEGAVKMWCVLLDQLGGVHLEGLGELADSPHPGLPGDLPALQAPDVVAGDGFAYAGGAEPGRERSCFYCLSGWVFLGSLNHDGDEVVDAVKCRKCNGSGVLPKR